MKKEISMLLILVLLLGLFAGCGGTPAADETDNDAASAGAVDYSKIKVGMLLSGTTNDGAWSQSMSDSLLRTKEELHLTDDQIILIESLPEGGAEADSTITKLIDEGCNLIIGTSSGYTVNINRLYAQYPDVYFTQFEGGEGKENFCSFTCNDTDGIFMLGYGAALMSQKDELGMIACYPQASVVRFIDAWAAGAKAANPNATVEVMWSNSWYDATADKECCNALIDMGMDCICYYGNTTAAAAACEEAGVYFTGYQAYLPEHGPNTCLNTFEWNWTPIFNQMVEEVATNQWSSEMKVGSMADDSARLRGWNTAIVSKEVIDKCDEMYNKILSGEYIVMEGPLNDNEGNQLLAEGETFTLDQLINCDFLIDNVVGSLS